MSLADEIELPVTEVDLRVEQGNRLNDLGMALHAEGYPPETVMVVLRRAMALLGQNAAVWSNMGLEFWRQRKLWEARDAFAKAIALDPTNHTYYGNAGVFASATGDGERAEKYLAEAIRLNPDGLGPKWDRALLHLWKGDWNQGLAEYDVRRAHRGPELYPGMPYPMWHGEDLTDKSLYVQGEQGVGDRILFTRYIAWVKETWPTCRIYSCLGDELINLMWSYGGVMEFLPQGIPWPDKIDYGVFLATLPQFHKSTPAHVPPDPGFIKHRLSGKSSQARLPAPNLPSLKVGICWTGNPKQTRNLDRTIPLGLMATLAEDPRITLYSVQCSPGQSDIAELGLGDIINDLGPGIEKEGWIGTALVLKELDVVVTCCTAIAHLAGALGVNCFTLLCRDPYWIWPRTGSTTVWYPGMRLFRQHTLGDWSPVIEEVKVALSALATNRLPRS